jgi:hypothetical protein
MSRARAQLVVGLLGTVLWGAWFLPPLWRSPVPPAAASLADLWALHVLPLAALLSMPVLGLEVVALFAFPASLVLPFAGAAAFGWELATPPRPGDLPLAAAAFLLYALAVPIALRRSRAPRPASEPRPLGEGEAPGRRAAERALALGRVLAAGLAPFLLTVLWHFDRATQLSLADSFGGDAGRAAVLIDLCVLVFAVVSADLAFFAPVRGLRRGSGPAAALARVQGQVAAGPSLARSGSLAILVAALLFLALLGYLAVRT